MKAAEKEKMTLKLANQLLGILSLNEQDFKVIQKFEIRRRAFDPSNIRDEIDNGKNVFFHVKINFLHCD